MSNSKCKPVIADFATSQKFKCPVNWNSLLQKKNILINCVLSSEPFLLVEIGVQLIIFYLFLLNNLFPNCEENV